MSFRAPSLVLLFLTAALLAGCGATTKTVTISTPPSGQGGLGITTATVTQGTLSKSATSTGGQAPARSVKEANFLSPTGNIGCVIADGTARCDISRREWSPPPRPSSCPQEVDYGQGTIVETKGPGRLVCAGDTAITPGSPRLPYGTASEVEGFTCVSVPAGITCTDPQDGHGFFISIQSYRVF